MLGWRKSENRALHHPPYFVRKGIRMNDRMRAIARFCMPSDDDVRRVEEAAVALRESSSREGLIVEDHPRRLSFSMTDPMTGKSELLTIAAIKVKGRCAVDRVVQKLLDARSST